MIDEQRLNAFLGKAVGDLGAAVSAVLVSIGDEHGSYKAPSTVLMAQAFPQSTFVGIDYHDKSIETARQRTKDAGVSNARFEVADAAADRTTDRVLRRLLRRLDHGLRPRVDGEEGAGTRRTSR
jgi:trans-aconitate methyltransferase